MHPRCLGEKLPTFRAGGGPPARDLAGLAGHGAVGSQRQRFHLLVDVDGQEQLDEHQVTILVGLVVARVPEDLGRAPPLLGATRVLVAPAPQPHVDEADEAEGMRVGGGGGSTLDIAGTTAPHTKQGAEAEPWSQKVVTWAEEAKAEKGRVSVTRGWKRGRVKPSEMPPTLPALLGWKAGAQVSPSTDSCSVSAHRHQTQPGTAVPVASYPETWQWAAVSTQFLSTNVPPQMNLSPLKRAACQGRSQEVPSITHRTFLEAVGDKGTRAQGRLGPSGVTWSPLVAPSPCLLDKGVNRWWKWPVQRGRDQEVYGVERGHLGQMGVPGMNGEVSHGSLGQTWGTRVDVQLLGKTWRGLTGGRGANGVGMSSPGEDI